MGPKTALGCSLLLYCLVDVGICLSSGEVNVRSLNLALITDIITKTPDEKVNSSGGELSGRYKRVPNEGYDEEDDEEGDVAGAPPDHQVPYSEHENPEEPSTKPKYVKPGDWAKPPPDRNIPLEFVPTKLYAQVRGTHTVKRVPREEAIATAETAEEILSAPRLREVVSKSKKNTIYTEEGYEDSAYDHAGHVRDADFHEGFARKLNDKRKSKLDSRKKKKDGEEEELKYEGSGDDEEELKNEESDDDEEFNEYDDDYRDHAEESTKVEETKSPKRGKKKAKGEKHRNIKGILRNSDINPKHVTENEIVRLEEDLEKEYAESEKNVEDEVPENLNNSETEDDSEEEESQSENLKKSGEDDEDDAEESKSEEDFVNDYDYGKRMDKNIDASREASRQFLKSRRGERKFGNKEFPVTSSTQSTNLRSTSTSANPTDFQRESTDAFTTYENFRNTQNPPGDFSSSTPNYGKVFWDYFKLVGDHWKPQKVSTPSDVRTTMTEAATLVPEGITSVPNFKSTASKLTDIDTFSFSPPTTFSFRPSTTELSDFVVSSTNMDSTYPTTDSLYDSWKRQDRGVNTEDNLEFGNMGSASNSYPEESEATTSFGRDLLMNVKRDETTTVLTPKKHSYTVIIRPRDRSTTTTPPCNREIHNRPEPTNSIGQLMSPKYTKVLNYLKDQPSPQEINNIAVKHQDFTVIQPPLSVPLRQVTYSDFLPDSYGSSVQQSVTQESVPLGKKLNGGRDWYHGLEPPYDKRFSNLFSHASAAPHFHHHHHGLQPPGANKRSHLHHHIPPTKLLPPSPVVKSSYAEFLGGKRLVKPRTRINRSPSLDPWSGILEFYRTIDRSIFGRRRRRSLESERKIEQVRDGNRKNLKTALNQRGKVNYHSFDASSEKDLLKRNFPREDANRLVALRATANVNLASDGNTQREKSSALRRRRNHEELLKKSPDIAEEVINAEIGLRFNGNEEDDENEDQEKYNDDAEKQRGKVDIKVPDFDVDEVIKEINDKKNEKIISEHPIKANKLDIEKYPFYENSKVPQTSALKYITNPRQVPRKTLGGTEFYDSRDKYLECEEVEPNLEKVVPEKEEPVPDREQQGQEPRLHGLGDKLDCFRAKYFDENPLDNPLFLEKQIDQPRAPEEFDPAKFASRIFEIPTDNQEQRNVVVRVSRKPEIRDLRRSGSRRNQVAHKDEENFRKVNNKNHRKEQEETTRNPRNRRKRPERPGQKKKIEQMTTETPQYHPVTPYERQVYEDVMGTIKNLAGMYPAYGEDVSPPLVSTNLKNGDRETDWTYPIRITERPRNFLIHGLLPPQTTAASDHQPLQRFRAFPYRTNKVTYRTRARTENPPGGEGIKVGYFRTVRVHKRSVEDTEIPEEVDMKESDNVKEHGKKNLTISTSYEKRISKDNAKKNESGTSKFSGNSEMDPEESGNITISRKQILISSSSFNKKPLQDIEIDKHSVARKVPEETDIKSRNLTVSGTEDLISSLTSKKKISENTKKKEILHATKITGDADTDISGFKNTGVGSRKKMSEKYFKDSRNIAVDDKKKLPSSFNIKKTTYLKSEKGKKSAVKEVPEESDLHTEESRNLAARSRKNLTSPLSVTKTTTQAIGKQEKPAASERVVYTIRDRIRHSKPRNGYGKNGKFSNPEAAATEDVRRREPRYNQIQRKKGSTSTIDPSKKSSDEKVEEEVSTATALKQDKTRGRQDFHDEPGEIYKIQFSTTQGTQTAPAANRRRDDDDTIDDEEDYEEEKQSEESRNDDTKEGNYAVRENVEDDVTTVSSLIIEPTETPEYRKLRKYLESEPPGYSEAFAEDSAESDSRYDGKKNNQQGEDGEEELDDEDEEIPTKYYQRAETRRNNEKEQEPKEDEDRGGEESDRPSGSYADEESSGKSGETEDGSESPVESESYKNSDNEEAQKDESSHDDEEEFDRFASRPFSPYESYDDPKYSDLGPRLSKPAFHHPSFLEPTSSKNRRGQYSAESERGSDEEGSEKTTRYIFPWEDDEAEDVEETKDSGHSIGRYEYPWEKRERLAKERRKKEKARRDYEKLFTFSDDSDDDEDEEEEEQNASNTELRGKRIYPWDYDVPSKNYHRGKISRYGQPIDNVEVGTEYRPVTKFSSRYKSKIFNLHDEGDPIVISGADPSQIRVSVIDSIKKASETKPVDPIQVLKNIVQPITTTVPTSTTNSYKVPEETSTKAPRRLRNSKKTLSTSSTTTIAPTTTIRPTRRGSRPRIWRTMSTTTKKPMRTRKRVSSLVDNELMKTGSRKKDILSPNSARKNDTNSSTISPLETTSTSINSKKIRRRGQIMKRPNSFTSTTVRPVRRRLTKSTAAPKLAEETTMKTVTDRTTTPRSKTVEHRSSFSKEEIITKTSYPGLNNDGDKESENDGNIKDNSKNERSHKDLKKENNVMNERIKKVSIVTKETPEHIYRTEEVDKDGVKGMFVSITPSNGSSLINSMEDPEDRPKDDEDTKEMMKRFRDFDDEENEQYAEDTIVQNSHLMANLLRQVPPFMNDLTFDESFQEEGNNSLESEGSGDVESDEDYQDHAKVESRMTYEKDPNNRLYYYVEK